MCILVGKNCIFKGIGENMWQKNKKLCALYWNKYSPIVRNIFLGFFLLVAIGGRIYNWTFPEEIERQYGELSKVIYSLEVFDNRVLNLSVGTGNIVIAKEVTANIDMGGDINDAMESRAKIIEYFLHHGWEPVSLHKNNLKFRNERYEIDLFGPMRQKPLAHNHWLVTVGFNTIFQRLRF